MNVSNGKKWEPMMSVLLVLLSFTACEMSSIGFALQFCQCCGCNLHAVLGVSWSFSLICYKLEFLRLSARGSSLTKRAPCHYLSFSLSFSERQRLAYSTPFAVHVALNWWGNYISHRSEGWSLSATLHKGRGIQSLTLPFSEFQLHCLLFCCHISFSPTLMCVIYGFFCVFQIYIFILPPSWLALCLFLKSLI